MKKPTDMGRNRTGIDASLVDSKKLMEVTSMTVPSSKGSEDSIKAIRGPYIAAGVPVGSRPGVFIDKLSERLAFERSGVRLYDALITKCELHPDKPTHISLDTLRHFREEEFEHMCLVRDFIKSIGADPTAQSPCADVAGVASLGVMQVLTDSRTTPVQCLEAILIAELADNDGWVMLINLADAMGFKEMADSFQQARATEDTHLLTIRQWLQEAILADEARAA